MFINLESWYDLITSILSGGFAGAAVVGVLSKFLIKNQLEKSLKYYQHELDTKKDILHAELTLVAEHAKLQITNHRQKSIAALESIYAGFVRTSLPRHGFTKDFRAGKANMSEDEINSEYFRLFSENFVAFDLAFKSVSAGFACLQENAIYIEDELESQVAQALTEVNSCCQKWHAGLRYSFDSALVIFKQGGLDQQHRTVNFEEFYTNLCADWNAITGPVTAVMKSKTRELLIPPTK